MDKRRFKKVALSTAESISFLKQKGLTFSDPAAAEQCLAYIGYYRLKIYMRPFEDAGGHKEFVRGTDFNDIVALYNFDRKLRLLCMDALERIEVSLRSHIINVMGKHGGPHFYYQERFFGKEAAKNKHERVRDLKMFALEAQHLSINHYRKTYCFPEMPPIWCLTEASTFGFVSKLYANLNVRYRKEIAKAYDLDESILVSWFRSLTGLRNICAHHGRLWNARLVVDQPKQAKAYKADLQDPDSFYSRAVLMIVLMGQVSPDAQWKDNFKLLIDEHPKVCSKAIRFPADWRDRTLWQ